MQVRNSSNPSRLGCSRDRSLPPKARLGVTEQVAARYRCGHLPLGATACVGIFAFVRATAAAVIRTKDSRLRVRAYCRAAGAAERPKAQTPAHYTLDIRVDAGAGGWVGRRRTLDVLDREEDMVIRCPPLPAHVCGLFVFQVVLSTNAVLTYLSKTRIFKASIRNRGAQPRKGGCWSRVVLCLTNTATHS